MKQQQKQLKQQNNKTQKKLSKPEQQTFLEHFYELRKRLFWVVFTLIVASAAGFQFKDQLIAAVMAPLHGEKLVYLTPAGGFSFIFTLSIYFGALLTIPVLIYHIYRFLQPLLATTSRRFVATFISLSILLATAGAAFGYFVTIPAAINFLANFAGDAVTPNLTAESYLNFVVSYVLGLAALFQLPLLLFLGDHIRPIPPRTLWSTQRFVVLGATILAAVITPTPDAFNMMIVAIPIIAVYELGAIAVAIKHHRLARRVAKQSTRATEIQQFDDTLDVLADNMNGAYGLSPYGVVESKTTPVKTGQAIDGITKARPAPQLVQSASRQAVITERFLAQQRAIAKRQQLRSVDGFAIVQNKPAGV